MKGEGNQLDFGARIYDSRVGRFLSVDPISKDIVDFSPYHFSFDSPIFLEDVNGMYGDPATQKPAAKPAMRVVRSAKVVKMTEQVKPGDTPWWMKLGRLSGRIGGTIGLVLTPVPSRSLPAEMNGDETYYAKHPIVIKNNFHEPEDPSEVILPYSEWLKTQKPHDDPEKEGVITLYRGVSEAANPALMYTVARWGVAIPKPVLRQMGNGGKIIQGHDDPDDHTAGDTESVFTSWTSDPETARYFATNNNVRGGIILKKTFDRRNLIIPRLTGLMGETEYLVRGVVVGAGVKYVKPRLSTDSEAKPKKD